jgi:predicted transcriptional regulator
MSLKKLDLAAAYVKNPTDRTVRGLLIASLSNAENRAYEFVANKKPATTAEVSTELGISIPNAGNILLRLLKFGLIQRRPESDESGLYYVWSKV